MDYLAIANEAHLAGMQAGTNVNPEPMYVQDGSTVHTINDGPCGFAWVHFKGNTAFGRAMKKAGIASTNSYGGLDIWVGHFRQSLSRKSAYAAAYVNVLHSHGIKATMGSRID